jgi:ankyrin repeat protein
VQQTTGAAAAMLGIDSNGWLPLHHCCTADSTQGHYKCAVALLDSGVADVAARTLAGNTD